MAEVAAGVALDPLLQGPVQAVFPQSAQEWMGLRLLREPQERSPRLLTLPVRQRAQVVRVVSRREEYRTEEASSGGARSCPRAPSET